jgi:hypothetical protein
MEYFAPGTGEGYLPKSNMQKKKNIILAVSLVVLVIASFMVYRINLTDDTHADQTIFRVPDFTKIDRVVLTSSEGEVNLTVDGSRWKVNGTYLADRNLIDVLFATLQQAEPKRPVAARLQDTLTAQLNHKGIHVKLYSGDELLKAFDAGGNSSKTEAYFKETDSSTPFIMVIPGYRVYVSGILELGASGWRDKYIFGFNWKNFSELRTSFPNKPAAGYTIRMDNNGVKLEGISNPDTARLNDFLDQVSLLTTTQFTKTSIDSVLGLNPIMKIIVKDVANREYSLNLYLGMKNSDLYLGVVNGIDPALFDARKIRSILRTKDYFLR